MTDFRCLNRIYVVEFEHTTVSYEKGRPHRDGLILGDKALSVNRSGRSACGSIPVQGKLTCLGTGLAAA